MTHALDDMRRHDKHLHLKHHKPQAHKCPDSRSPQRLSND
ncbi:MAG: hypothetical protein RIR37_1250, partial [Verrucomicrobiota bacterium]